MKQRTKAKIIFWSGIWLYPFYWVVLRYRIFVHWVQSSITSIERGIIQQKYYKTKERNKE